MTKKYIALQWVLLEFGCFVGVELFHLNSKTVASGSTRRPLLHFPLLLLELESLGVSRVAEPYFTASKLGSHAKDIYQEGRVLYEQRRRGNNSQASSGRLDAWLFDLSASWTTRVYIIVNFSS
ncbi:hypothetical protein M405DRAFT_846004 [Rhizopogon salebrosus TDB-379]|nr:hypothetical protein M405DRAFT_846004 [Rhizopogon salebrosus TDB-379]